MTWMVELVWGTTAPQPGLFSVNTAAMIGFAADISSMESNPVKIFSAGELTANHGLSTDDILYKAAADYFAGGGKSLWVYALVNGDNGATITDVELTGLKNGTNYTFSSPYTPVSNITNVRVLKNGADATVNTAGTHYDINETYTGSGIYTGSITFTPNAGSGGAYWTDGVTPEYDIAPTSEYTILADITTSGVGKAYQALNKPGIQFSAICFAYDQDLEQKKTSLITDTDFKFHPSRCYAGEGWLSDMIEGAAMASNFASAGKMCQFIGVRPDFMNTTDKITAAYANGTAYDSGTYEYSQLLTIIGVNKWFAMMGSSQTTEGKDFSSLIMGSIMNERPRSTIKYMPVSGASQTDFPLISEILAWDAAQINVLAAEYYTDGTQAIILSGNNTFGQGQERDFNYIRCKIILTNKLLDNLKYALMKRDIRFNARGAQRVYDIIDATLQWAIDNDYINGKEYINIPVKSYLENINSLSEGERDWLDTEEATGAFNNVEIAYKWDNDVEKIVISALVNT